MKTLLICIKEFWERHQGEIYDEIIWVDSNIDASKLPSWLPRIQDAIRLTLSEGVPSKSISITLDAPMPYAWICQQLQISMKENEQIEIIIPNLDQKLIPEGYNPNTEQD